MEYLINLIKGNNNSSNQKSIYEKNEDELTLEDRLQLINEDKTSKNNIISALLPMLSQTYSYPTTIIES